MDLHSTDLQLMNWKSRTPTTPFIWCFQLWSGSVELQILWMCFVFSFWLSWESQRLSFQLLSFLIIICAALTFMIWMVVRFLFLLSMEIQCPRHMMSLWRRLKGSCFLLFFSPQVHCSPGCQFYCVQVVFLWLSCYGWICEKLLFSLCFFLVIFLITAIKTSHV